MKLRLFKPSTIDTDEQIHKYTEDIHDLMKLINGPSSDENREMLEYNLKIMILVQQRLLEARG